MPVFMMPRPSRAPNTKGPSKPMSGYAGPVSRSEAHSLSAKPSYGQYTKPVNRPESSRPNPLISQPPQTTQPIGRPVVGTMQPNPLISQPPVGGNFGQFSRPWAGSSGLDLSDLFLRRARESVQPIFGQRI